MNILVIPEDCAKDQYILKPIVEELAREAGCFARVRICQNPRLRGVDEALKKERILEILDQYRGTIQLFLLIVDRDCDEHRHERLDQLEGSAASFLEGSSRIFIAELAWQEIEVWVLAGMNDLPEKWRWADIRAHCDPKEAYFMPYVKLRKMQQFPYNGRAKLAQEAAEHIKRIIKRCPEDVAALARRIKTQLEN